MYRECEGDMDKIIDSVMCATVEDEPRFVKILKDLIKTKEVPKYPAFNRTTSKTQSTSRKRKVNLFVIVDISKRMSVIFCC